MNKRLKRLFWKFFDYDIETLDENADASWKTGIYPSGIRNVVIGKKKSAGGYSWERC